MSVRVFTHLVAELSIWVKSSPVDLQIAVLLLDLSPDEPIPWTRNFYKKFYYFLVCMRITFCYTYLLSILHYLPKYKAAGLFQKFYSEILK